MRVLDRALSWVGRVFGPRETVVKRFPLPGTTSGKVTPVPASSGSETHAPGTGMDCRQAAERVKRIGITCRTDDDVVVRLDDLVLSVRRKIDLDVPFEVTVVVPRAEVTEKYRDGTLVQRTLVYSSITIAHSPRFEGLRR